MNDFIKPKERLSNKYRNNFLMKTTFFIMSFLSLYYLLIELTKAGIQ